ncbi:hypothetical protein D3C76_537890 [compost metagenome]
MVGVTHMAVPVDPEDTHGALIDGELAQAQRLFAHLALNKAFPRGQQAALQLALLTALPHQRGQGTQQQQTEQQGHVLPEARRLAQARVLRLQPALMQLFQLLGRHCLQATFKYIGQQRPVAPRTDTQQLRQANIADHRQLTELALARQAAELRFIQHGETGLATYHQLQGLTIVGHPLQVEVAVVAAQVIRQRAGHAHRDALLGFKLFQLHGHGPGARPHHQLWHAHVWVAK